MLIWYNSCSKGCSHTKYTGIFEGFFRSPMQSRFNDLFKSICKYLQRPHIFFFWQPTRICMLFCKYLNQKKIVLYWSFQNKGSVFRLFLFSNSHDLVIMILSLYINQIRLLLCWKIIILINILNYININ